LAGKWGKAILSVKFKVKNNATHGVGLRSFKDKANQQENGKMKAEKGDMSNVNISRASPLVLFIACRGIFF
jgi:hypothetical protein